MSKYETPDYDILLKEEEFEIRKYLDFFIVEYEDSDDPEVKGAFGSLFKYISNDNQDEQKMSMTVPVIQQEKEEQRTMAFVVPAEFEDKIPEPNNKNLRVRRFDEGLFASIRYSGLRNDSKQRKMKEQLEEWIEAKDYQRESNYMLASYNSPFTLPAFRRNEIWARVSEVK